MYEPRKTAEGYRCFHCDALWTFAAAFDEAGHCPVCRDPEGRPKQVPASPEDRWVWSPSSSVFLHGVSSFLLFLAFVIGAIGVIWFMVAIARGFAWSALWTLLQAVAGAVGLTSMALVIRLLLSLEHRTRKVEASRQTGPPESS